jgi:hemerythrin-like metal-binding protein
MPRTWTPSLAIGVPAIDQQHQELFRRSDDLLDALSRGAIVQEVIKLVGFLEQYVLVHFKAEEKLMASRGYPELTRHQLLHQEFIREFNDIRDKLAKAPSTSLGLRMNALMGGWLVKHIGAEDTKVAAFLGNDGARVSL